MVTKNAKQKVFLHAITNKKRKRNFANDFEKIKFRKIKNTKTIENDVTSKKRSIDRQAVNIYIDYLVVLDQSVFNKYKKLYKQLDDDLVMQFLKIQFCQIVNGVNKD
jgi:hypothetical protein